MNTAIAPDDKSLASKYDILTTIDGAIDYLTKLANDIRGGGPLPVSSRLVKTAQAAARQAWCEHEFAIFDVQKAIESCPSSNESEPSSEIALPPSVTSSPPARQVSALEYFLRLDGFDENPTEEIGSGMITQDIPNDALTIA